ncbi:hypothetical protein RRG08_030552 [Elysia crispata]|uniref:Uncharacterized protein n=1 Tax=Elysia crispata TaxID=231223 RepID=A0AAE1DJK1_9GAST|nr:hypothetical protein RRG08_030552 [Elysia crispata]
MRICPPIPRVCPPIPRVCPPIPRVNPDTCVWRRPDSVREGRTRQVQVSHGVIGIDSQNVKHTNRAMSNIIVCVELSVLQRHWNPFKAWCSRQSVIELVVVSFTR